MIRQLREWLEIRIGLEELIRSQLTEYRVPKNINLFYTLGMMAFVAFLFQSLTGILLLFYYIPDEKDAFQSIQFIMNQVPYGWLFRLMHTVGSNLMVAVVIVHMGSVFFLGAYKKPRELTWVVGAFMLLTTLGFCLSGYLLPWSQLSFWATTVVTNIPTAFPFFGELVCKLLRGGENVSGTTLNRFFAVHVAFLPSAADGPLWPACLFGEPDRHLRSSLGRRKAQPWTEFRHDSHPDGLPFYPYFVAKETVMIAVYFVIMFPSSLLRRPCFFPPTPLPRPIPSIPPNISDRNGISWPRMKCSSSYPTGSWALPYS